MTHSSGGGKERHSVTAGMAVHNKATGTRVRPYLQGRKAAYWYARGRRQRGHRLGLFSLRPRIAALVSVWTRARRGNDVIITTSEENDEKHS
jgi:hypothetical protein